MELIDQKVLDAIKSETRCDIETKQGNNFVGVVIKDFKLPHGMYNFNEVDILFLVPDAYQRTGLNMFFTSKIIKFRENNMLPNQTQIIYNLFGQQWQRWSRHYTWDPEVHDILTHLDVIILSLEMGQFK